MATPMTAPIAAGPAPSRNERAAVLWRSALEASSPSENEDERWRERDDCGQQTARNACRGVADNGDGLHDGTRRDLAERYRVEKLATRHPVVLLDGVVLHQRDDDEAAAVGERPDLERDPNEREDTAAGRRREYKERTRMHAEPAGRAEVSNADLDRAATQQHDHQPRSNGRRRDPACERVDHPSAMHARALPARGDEAGPRVHGDRRHDGTRACACSEDPGGW